MSYVRIWVHVVFSTLSRKQTLDEEGRHLLLTHIKQQCAQKDIYLDCIGGYTEHIHLLISLNKKQCIADVVQQIKGESSFWANQQKLFRDKLYWQDDYFAVSVGESQVEVLRKYITLQKEHHTKKTFAEEVSEFLNKYGWAK